MQELVEAIIKPVLTKFCIDYSLIEDYNDDKTVGYRLDFVIFKEPVRMIIDIDKISSRVRCNGKILTTETFNKKVSRLVNEASK